MGFQDALYELGIPYGSDEAVQFADESAEVISYYAIDTSAELARERGAYSSFDGSLWSQGVLPMIQLKNWGRTWSQLSKRGHLAQLDWTELRKAKNGMRNSNVMAIQQPRSQTSLACRNRLNPRTKIST